MSFNSAIVTGASGFLGRYVVRELLAAGRDVTSVSDGEEAVEGCRHLQIDLTEPGLVADWSVRADVLIHLAARSAGIQGQDDMGMISANATMTLSALRITELAQCKSFVLASSGVVYEPPEVPEPIDESDALILPSSPWLSSYSWSKITSEVQSRLWTAKDGGRLVIARLATLFGLGGNVDHRTSSVVHALLHRISQTPEDESVEVWGDGTPIRSFSHVTDAARALVFLADSDVPGDFNVTTTPALSISDLAHLLLVTSGRDPSQVRFLTDKPKGPAYRALDGSKLQRLGFEPEFDLESGLLDTWADFSGVSRDRR